MAVVFEKPHALADIPFHYCPGCTHGIVHRLVAEAIDELGVEGNAVGIASVGCSVFSYNYFNYKEHKGRNRVFAWIMGYRPKSRRCI